MSLKKVLSVFLASVMLLTSLAVGASAIDPDDYDSNMLSYLIEHQPTYIQSEYTADSWSRYTTAYASADAALQGANQAAIDYNVAYLSAAQASLLKPNETYYSKILFNVASQALASATFIVQFKEITGAAIENVTFVTDNESIVVGTPTYDATSGMYSAVLDTSALPAATLFSTTISYTYDSRTYNSTAYTTIGTPGSHFSTAKGELGALVAYELAYNRQSWMYASGWSTYVPVFANTYKTFNNPTATTDQVSRAVYNINSAVSSLAYNYANYTDVYAAIAEANQLNPDNYYSFNAVTDAVAAVVYEYPMSRQDEVDAMATSIRDAIDGLVYKVARYKVVCNLENGDNLQTSDWITGTLTYVVRVMAPAIPGYAPTQESITVTLETIETYVTFTYVPVTYSVTFYPMGGTVTPTDKTLVFDSPYGTLPTPEMPGYTFLGWFSDPIAGEQVTEDTPVTVNYYSSLYAHWSDIESYTLAFVSNGGSAIADITQIYGTDITLPTPIKYGYDLVNWYYDAALSNVASFTTIPDLGNSGDVITLYAKWTARVYDVTLDATGGVSDPATLSVTYGSTYGTLPTPTRDGYDFVGWFTDAEGGTVVESTTSVLLENVHSIYAHWTVCTYTLSFETDGGTAILPVTQVFGTPLSVTAPTKEGYLFDCWTFNDEPISLATMPAGNITVTAKWILNRVAEYSFFVYKKVGTQIIPADTLVAGELFFVEVRIKANYLAGAGRFGVFYSLGAVQPAAAVVARAYTWNTTSAYVSAMASKSGNTNYSSLNWASLFEDDPTFDTSQYQCTTPYTTATTTAANIDEETTIVTLNLKMKTAAQITAAGLDSVSIFMDERACRGVDNTSSGAPTYLTAAMWNESQQKYEYDNTNIIADVSRASITIPIATYTSAIGAATGSTTEIDHRSRTITGLAENLSFTDFSTNYATVLGTTGNLSSNDTLIKTGSVINVMNGADIVSSYTAIIYGDVNSDGIADANDAFIVHMIINGLLSEDDLTPYQFEACDVNHDGSIGLSDTLVIERSGLKKATVDQTANS